MDTRHRKIKHNDQFKNSTTFIYNDNLSKDLIQSFASTTTAANIVICDAETFGKAKNISDPDFFDVLSVSINREPNAGAIVLTTDLASKDKGMAIAISQHAENDYICTIKFSGSLGKNKKLPIIAKDVLFSTKGFKVIDDVYQRYVEILLSKSERNLIIRAKERNGKISNKTIKNVFDCEDKPRKV